MLKCFLPFSHSFLIFFGFSFPYIYLLLDKFFASICLNVYCYNYSTSLCYQSIVVLLWLTWVFLYVSCSKLFWFTTFYTICSCNCDQTWFVTTFHSWFVAILQHCVCFPFLPFPFISYLFQIMLQQRFCQRSCMLVYNLHCFVHLDDFEVGEN